MPRQVVATSHFDTLGSITDVEGITVGHHQRTGRGWLTGTTVVLAPDGATPGVDVRGGGPGTRETDALRPENLNDRIHALCLTGGSAYGLGAADGVVAWSEERGLGFRVGAAADMIVPVVPAAVIYDLGRGARFDARPDATFGYRAAADARAAQRRWGSVGAGTGAIAGGLQGGVGTSSTTVRILGCDGELVDVTVGALAVVNANGLVVDRATGLPWEHEGFDLRRPTAAQRRELREAIDARRAGALNTTIGVVATSARLDKTEVQRLAVVAHDGLARAIRPAHAMVDGDTIFALATGRRPIVDRTADVGLRTSSSRHAALDTMLDAAATTFASACTHAVLAAVPRGGPPTFGELCPSAMRV